MASAFSHGFVAFLAGKSFAAEKMPSRYWTLSIVCSILPDLDVIGFAFGVQYADFLGHRGFSHSLLFAFLLGVCVAIAFFRNIPLISKKWWRLVCYFFLITASHGFLDAMTNGGLGIAFFSPFDTTRYFLPWRPVVVSSIGIFSFFNSNGVEVLVSELVWILLPSLFLFMLVDVLRKNAASRRREEDRAS